jgi:MoaA/NifB/PqqE/SkfB family radical SAM enzyme
MKFFDSICCFKKSNDSKKRLLWEITTRCNLNCPFCHAQNNVLYEPSFKLIKSIVPLLKQIGIEEIIISGGEPFLRNDIFEILLYLKRNLFEVDICTNGTLINIKRAKKLSEILSEISVSVDSFLEKKNDKYRGIGSWEKTMHGIRCLLDCGIDVHTISILNIDTLDDIEKNISFLSKLGVKSITFIGQISVEDKFNPLISDEIQEYLKEKFKALREVYSNISINTREVFINSGFNKCFAGINLFAISADMNLYPCLLRKDLDYIDLSKNVQGIDDLFRILRTKVHNIQDGEGICPGSKIFYYKGKNISNNM